MVLTGCDLEWGVRMEVWGIKNGELVDIVE